MHTRHQPVVSQEPLRRTVLQFLRRVPGVEPIVVPPIEGWLTVKAAEPPVFDEFDSTFQDESLELYGGVATPETRVVVCELVRDAKLGRVFSPAVFGIQGFRDVVLSQGQLVWLLQQDRIEKPRFLHPDGYSTFFPLKGRLGRLCIVHAARQSDSVNGSVFDVDSDVMFEGRHRHRFVLPASVVLEH